MMSRFADELMEIISHRDVQKTITSPLEKEARGIEKNSAELCEKQKNLSQRRKGAENAANKNFVLST
jgi:hypothetical protein